MRQIASGTSSEAAEFSSAVVALEFTSVAASSWDWSKQERQTPTVSARLSAFATRSFDCAVAVTLLVLGLPVWVLISLAIVSLSPGPVFFRQTRCGQGGRHFTCYKFRTMVVDAERRLKDDVSLAAAHAGQWKLSNDPRVTALGRWLRKSSLDEVPQLWNVVRGDMGLVGPRPVQEKELIQVYGSLADTITSVRPGLTGLWQVSGRSTLSYDKRIELDLDYVRQRSFRYDITLILKTIPAVLFGKGAV